MLIICILMLSTSIAIGAEKATSANKLTKEQLKTARLSGEEYFNTKSREVTIYQPPSKTQQNIDAILKSCEKEGINDSTIKLYALLEANRRATDNSYCRWYRQKASEIADEIFNSSESFRKEAEAAQIVPVKPTTELGHSEGNGAAIKQELLLWEEITK